MNCPGDRLSGLVDGELDHATRERVHAHLLDCTPCRREVEVLRALKLQLSWARVETPVPPDELTARLMAMVVPDMDPAARKAPVRVRPATGRPVNRADAQGPGRRVSPRVRRRTTSGALLTLGLVAAFVLGGPASARESQVPVDPASDSFIADFMSTTVDASYPVVDASVVGSAP